VGRPKCLLAASISLSIAAAIAGPVDAASAESQFYDPSSPAGAQYSDPLAQGRTAGGAHAHPGTAPEVAAPPSRPASSVGAFGEGITPRTARAGPGDNGTGKADSGRAAGSDPPARDGVAASVAADRAVAARELADVGAYPTGDLLLIAGIAAMLVLGAAALVGTALRRLRRGPQR
jgi:hypothetical protein